MTIDRNTVATVLAVIVQAAIGICAKHGYLTAEDTAILMGAVVAVLAAFHVPNSQAAQALAKTTPAQPAAATPNEPTPVG